MIITTEQRLRWRALLLAVCLSLVLAGQADAAHAATREAPTVLSPGAGFDGRHQTAVSRLQSRLLRLGYAPGPLTRRALRAQARPEPGRVKLVQRRLRALGRRPGPVDGIFGERTVRAVR